MLSSYNYLLTVAFLTGFLLMTNSIEAQTSRIGIKGAYGHSDNRHENDREIEPPFEEGDFNFMKLGLEYQHFLNPVFSVNGGLSFFSRFGDFGDFNYLAIPMSLDLNLGKEVQFIFGMGIDLSYLIDYELKEPYGYSVFDGFEESKNRFQIGWQAHGGIGVSLSPQSQLRLMYEHHIDLTKMYAKEQGSPGGALYTQDRWWYDGYISLTFLTGSFFYQKESKEEGK